MNLAVPVKADQKSTHPCANCADGACPLRCLLGESWFEDCPDAVEQITTRCGEKIEAARFEPDTVFRISSGMLMQEHVLADGRRHVAAFRTDGDLTWPLGNASDIREFYEAVKPTHVCAISVKQITKSVPASKELVQSLYESARQEVTRAQAQMFSLARSSATERLAWFLSDMADRIGRKTRKGTEFRLNMRRERIADHLGMQPETISRVMSQFKKAGLIELPRPTHVIIPDLRHLGKVAYGAAVAPAHVG